jgi:hypothetical protein
VGPGLTAAGYGRSSQRLPGDIHELCHEIVHPAVRAGADILEPHTTTIGVDQTARSARHAPATGPPDR